MATCQACGQEIEARGGRGEPRRYCLTCLPPESLIGKRAYNRIWRALNAETVKRRNELRRLPRSRRNCTICGSLFWSADPLVVHCPKHRRRHDEPAGVAVDRSDRIRDHAAEYRRYG